MKVSFPIPFNSYGHTKDTVSINQLESIRTQTCDDNSYIKSTTITISRPDNKQNHCRTAEEVNVHLRKGSPLAHGVMCFVSSCCPVSHRPKKISESKFPRLIRP